MRIGLGRPHAALLLGDLIHAVRDAGDSEGAYRRSHMPVQMVSCRPRLSVGSPPPGSRTDRVFRWVDSYGRVSEPSAGHPPAQGYRGFDARGYSGHRPAGLAPLRSASQPSRSGCRPATPATRCSRATSATENSFAARRPGRCCSSSLPRFSPGELRTGRFSPDGPPDTQPASSERH